MKHEQNFGKKKRGALIRGEALIRDYTVIGKLVLKPTKQQFGRVRTQIFVRLVQRGKIKY